MINLFRSLSPYRKWHNALICPLEHSQLYEIDIVRGFNSGSKTIARWHDGRYEKRIGFVTASGAVIELNSVRFVAKPRPRWSPYYWMRSPYTELSHQYHFDPAGYYHHMRLFKMPLTYTRDPKWIMYDPMPKWHKANSLNRGDKYKLITTPPAPALAIAPWWDIIETGIVSKGKNTEVRFTLRHRETGHYAFKSCLLEQMGTNWIKEFNLKSNA